MIKLTKIKNAISKAERTLINLATGKKKAKSDKDDKLLRDIEAIKKKGGMIYIPHD